MAKLTYAEQLLDPRWQRLRLKVLDAAEWECQNCGDANSTLHVHHMFYRKGAAPWEYEIGDLACLCAKCHAAWHDQKSSLEYAIARIGPQGLARVAGYALALIPGFEVGINLRADGRVTGVSDAIGVSEAVILSKADSVDGAPAISPHALAAIAMEGVKRG